MGNGLYGVEVAAEYYFGKSCTELTLSECASLAGITNLPEYYRPDKNPENNLKRRNLILGLMLNQKLITQEEYDDAIDDELKVVADKSVLKETEINSYFVDALIEDVVNALVEKFGYEKEHAESNFYNSGYRIYATLDPDIQAAMESVYTDSKYSLTSKKGKQLQGSMTIMDYEGHVLGLIGGMGEKKENRGLNRATQSPRQPGSTIKPLAAYAPAIENDLITYSSILNDSNKKYNAGGKQWRPTNWYGGNYGNMTAKRALEMSVNTIPVYLVDLMTLPVSYNFLHETLGMESLNENDLYSYAALGMGGMNRGITTQESAAAFAMFGNGGRYYKPITFTEIYDQYGNLVLSNSSSPTVAIGEDTASIMNKMLQRVVSVGTGKDAKLKGVTVGGKTGTSANNADNWFIGYTPEYSCAVWHSAINEGNISAKVFTSVFENVDYTVKDFIDKGNITPKIYCEKSGLLRGDNCLYCNRGYYSNKHKLSKCHECR
jgi:penicillin-binding protein 1A